MTEPTSETNLVSLRERNRQRTKQRIVQAAIELFRSLGYDQTTMDNIAEKAEVSRATLFNYFPTKDSLLLPFAAEIFQTHIQPDVTGYLETQPTTIDALRVLFMSVHKYVLTISDLDRALKREFVRPRDVDAAALPKDDGFIMSLTLILQYGQQRGDVRADIGLESLIRYIGALSFSIFYTVILQIGETDYQVEVDKLLNFIQHGLQAV